MFCAEIIAFDEVRRQNHVYDLLVTLKHLSANKLRHKEAKISTESSLQQSFTDKGWLKLAFHDADTDILARIVARMSACRSACHRNNFNRACRTCRRGFS